MHVALTANFIKLTLGLTLTPEETELESKRTQALEANRKATKVAKTPSGKPSESAKPA